MTLAVGSNLALQPQQQDITIRYATEVPGMRYALAAYALSRLTLAYHGAVARVQRVVDGAQTDAYEYQGELWTARFGRGQALAAWASGSDIRVAVWYDQSGRGRHAVQADPVFQPLLLLLIHPSMSMSTSSASIAFSGGTFLAAPPDAIPTRGYCVAVRYATESARAAASGGVLAVSDATGRRQVLLSGGSAWTDPDGAGNTDADPLVIPAGGINVSISYDPAAGSITARSDSVGSVSVATNSAAAIASPEQYAMGDDANLDAPRHIEVGGGGGEASISRLVIFEGASVSGAPEFSLQVPPRAPGGPETFVSSNVPLGTEALFVQGISDNSDWTPLLSRTSSNADLFNQDRIRHLATGHVWQVSDGTILLPTHTTPSSSSNSSLCEGRWPTAMVIEGSPGVPGSPGSLYLWSRANLSNVLNVAPSNNTTLGGPTWLQDRLLATGADAILSNSAHLDAYAPQVTFSNAEMYVGCNVLVRGITYATTPNNVPQDAAAISGLSSNACALFVIPSASTATARIGLGHQVFVQSTSNHGVSVHLSTTNGQTSRPLWIASNGCVGFGDTTYVPSAAQLEVRPTACASNGVLAFQDATRGGLRHVVRSRHAESNTGFPASGDAIDILLNASSNPSAGAASQLSTALTISRAGLWTPTHISVGRHSNAAWSTSNDVPHVQLDDVPSTKKLVLLRPATYTTTSFHGLGATLTEVQFRAPNASVDHVFYGGGSNGTQELMRLGTVGMELASGGKFHGACNVDAANAYSLADIKVLDATTPARALRNLAQAHINLPLDQPVVASAPPSALRSHAAAASLGGGMVMYANNSPQGASLTVSARDVSQSNSLGITGSNDLVQLGLQGSSNAYLRATSCNGLELQLPCLRASEGASLRLRSGSNASTNAITVAPDNKVGIALSNGLLPTTYALEVTGDVYTSGDVLARSDARSKANVAVIENALEKVAALRGVTYSLCNDPGGRRCTGLIAQDVQKVLPEAVRADADTGLLSVAYGNLIGLLVEAIHELQQNQCRC